MMIRFQAATRVAILMYAFFGLIFGADEKVTWGDDPSESYYEIYVSLDGDDQGEGTESDPFATIQRAQKAVREILEHRRREHPDVKADPKTNGIKVLLSKGPYRLTEPLVFGPKDSSSGYQVSYVPAYGNREGGKIIPDNEIPFISGGRPITGFSKNDDGTWSVEIPEVKSGEWSFRQLWVNDARAVRAREPDEGFVRVEQIGEDNRTNFIYAEGDVEKPANLEGLELVFLHDWSITRTPVASIDESTRRLTVKHGVGCGSSWSVMNWFERDPRYFLENAREYVDEPGEWYLDETSGVLTYFPKDGMDPNILEVIAPVASQLIVVKGEEGRPVRNLSFHGLRLEHAAWNAPDDVYWGRQACTYWTPSMETSHCEADPAAVQLDMAENCWFVGISVRHVGSSGIWIGSRCVDNHLQGSLVTDCGGNGFMVGEGQVRQIGDQPWWDAAPEQATSETHIVRCYATRCGQELYGAVGVWVGLAAKTNIIDNKVFDHPYTGVSVGWMWWDPRGRPEPRVTPCRDNQIIGNTIHHCMMTLSDGGCVYILGAQPGSVIARNILHDIPPNAGRAESNGMFLDQGVGYFVIKENLIYNVERSPLRFHKGWENQVQDNIMALEEGVPMVRYNDTVQERIELDGNVVFPTAEEAIAAHQKMLEERPRLEWEPMMRE
jgi:hypothetical protein